MKYPAPNSRNSFSKMESFSCGFACGLKNNNKFFNSELVRDAHFCPPANAIQFSLLEPGIW
jgi:hypothetical protein